MGEGDWEAAESAMTSVIVVVVLLLLLSLLFCQDKLHV